MIGFLIGFAIKKVMKILVIVGGIFFAVLVYLQSQTIVNINWDKLQSTVTTIANSLTDAGQVSTIAGNLGIPLTGGLAAGFAIGLAKG